ncbi:MAG: hypothetical protein MJ219_03045 [Mycoplasmoidaceae bacterium]|nr:hypothetical protein [Mycoplasmoidaceae bacterium]
MKFKSKFIPIMASCTLIGTIAPISLASCSRGSENGSFKYLDLVEEHIPTDFEPLSSSESFATATEATLEYID